MLLAPPNPGDQPPNRTRPRVQLLPNPDCKRSIYVGSLEGLDAVAKRHATVRLAGTLLRGQLGTAVDPLTDLGIAAERDHPGPVAFAEDDDHLVVGVEGGEVDKDASWSGQRDAQAFNAPS
jgi:hypothetical protein